MSLSKPHPSSNNLFLHSYISAYSGIGCAFYRILAAQKEGFSPFFINYGTP